MVDRVLALLLETTFTCIEHGRGLEMLGARLAEGLWTLAGLSALFVESWTWHLKLKALPIEDLVVSESG